MLALVLSLRASLDGYIFAPPSKHFFDLIDKYRDELWDLHTPIRFTPTRKAYHNFIKLSAGTTIHYLTEDGPTSIPRHDSKTGRDLVIFLHGWPDSSLLWLKTWAHLSTSSSPASSSTLVAPDLPGFGASDGLPVYDGDHVLNAIAEFIYRMRQKYMGSGGKLLLVSFDWGGAIAGRLAVEAPDIADHFILINGPVLAFVRESFRRRASSCTRSLRSFEVSRAWTEISPALVQVANSFYIFVFDLPSVLGEYLLPFAFWCGRRCFIRSVGRLAVTGQEAGPLPRVRLKDERDVEERMAEHLAAALGPGKQALNSALDGSAQRGNGGLGVYGQRVRERVTARSGWGNVETDSVRYYREGLGSSRWRMSALVKERYSESSQRGVMEKTGRLKTPATIVWGKKDPALDWRLMTQGIEHWSAGAARVRLVDEAAHWLMLQEGEGGIDVVVEEITRAIQGFSS